MHLLNTSVHFPGLPLIVVAEGEFHLTWDEDATVGAGLKGIPLAYQFTSFEATGFDALEGIGAEDNLEPGLIPLVQCFEEFIRLLIDADANKFTYRQFVHPHSDWFTGFIQTL